MSNLHTHSHGTENISNKVLLWTVIINLGLSVFEFAAGALSGSVALIADALHNTNDAGALLVAYIARKISSRGADETFTFGYRRAELIGAVIQLVGLIMVGLYLIYEAIRRLFEPQPLEGGWIIAAGGVALVVDFATAWLLWSMSKGNANVRAAFLHNLTDAGASIAVLFGGAAIFWLDWTWVDPAITLIIALYIIYISLGMLKSTGLLKCMFKCRQPLRISLLSRRRSKVYLPNNLISTTALWKLKHRTSGTLVMMQNYLTMNIDEKIRAKT